MSDEAAIDAAGRMLRVLSAPNVGMAVLQGDDLDDLRRVLTVALKSFKDETWYPIGMAAKAHGETLLLWGSLEPDGPPAMWLGSWFQPGSKAGYSSGFWQVNAIRLYPTHFRAAPLPPTITPKNCGYIIQPDEFV